MESNLQDVLSQQMLEIDTEFDKFSSQITDNQLSKIVIDSTYQGATSSRFQLHSNSSRRATHYVSYWSSKPGWNAQIQKST